MVKNHNETPNKSFQPTETVGVEIVRFNSQDDLSENTTCNLQICSGI